MILYEGITEKWKNSPKMLCIVGDLQNDISYYKKAIEISNGKSLRAYNSLGYYHFNWK